MVRVHAKHKDFEGDGEDNSIHTLVNYDCEVSVLRAGLFLRPRGSGAVNIVVASGNPSFADPTPSLKIRTSPDERG